MTFVEVAVKRGELTCLDVPEPKIEIWKQLIHHRNKWMSKSLSALISHIKVMEFNKD